ncbi:MAG: beta-lactamase family protein [Deltaproteobacteria bacterium]|nr:beta-lactamase family protein [Deltaproteobacteria bacterium]
MPRFLPLLLIACSASPSRPAAKPVATDADPEGPHRAAVAAQVKPYLDGEIVSGLVIGLYAAGKLEIYGFGKGPGGGAPDGRTLFEIGSITKVFTGVLLADAVQRKEVELDTPVAELLPAGVTVPTADKVAITLRHLALHGSGLPRLPPRIAPTAANPYAKYTEEELYRDLVSTELEAPPGQRIIYSNFGAGLLGFALGRKIGPGYMKALETRVIKPLGLTDTFFVVPPEAAKRRAIGTDVDLQPVPLWTWTDALAGAGGLTSSVRDQLKLIEAELDAAAGGKSTLRGALRFTQEEQLEETPSDNAGLGWMIDTKGRYHHNGGTSGARSFIAFDPKSRHGVVVLASTGSSLVDRLGGIMLDLLAKTAKPPGPLASPAQLTAYAGTYDLAGTRLQIVLANHRLYLEGPGEPRHRMVPVTDVAFWIEALQSVAFFHKEGDAIKHVVFQIGDRQLVAPRVP